MTNGGIRRLYVNRQPSTQVLETLKTRGYDVINLRTLPRDEPHEYREWILGYTQAMLDGTIKLNDNARRTLELEAKICGLLINKNMNVSIQANANMDVRDLLNSIGGSRYLIKNTSLENQKQAEKASLIPGEKFSDV